MRNEFAHHLCSKIRSTPSQKVAFFTGDLGFSVLEPIRELLGDKFVNVGVAEALMVSAAAGIADSGYKAYTYSITPFATFRCLEQIRNDVAYHKLDVTVVGIGAGFGYGTLGPTHHATEDLAAIWSIPNMRVYSPGDLNEAEACFEDAWQHAGPKYLRLSKGGDAKLSKEVPSFRHDQAVVAYSEGRDLSLVVTGNLLSVALELATRLKSQGKQVQVLSVPVVKPFPARALLERLTGAHVAVLEELNPYGGFSGQVAKTLLEGGQSARKFSSHSALDAFATTVGSSDFQRRNNRLSVEALEADLKARF